jgi:hypothetical protein
MKTFEVELYAGTAEIGIVDVEILIQKVIKARKAIEIRNIKQSC